MASGIYQLTHKDTGRIYIGQSKDLESRFRQHKSAQKRSRKITYIEKAIGKYGWDAFDAKVIVVAKGKEYPDLLEFNAIKAFDCMSPKGFNLREGGYSSEFSAETRKKMSDIRKEYLKNPDVIANLSAKRKQQIITKDQYLKASKAQSQLKWMNNGNMSCRVSPEKVEEMKSNGFVFGRIKNYITDEYKNKQSQNAYKQWSKVK
jgi:group I intron endonuclease